MCDSKEKGEKINPACFLDIQTSPPKKVMSPDLSPVFST